MNLITPNSAVVHSWNVVVLITITTSLCGGLIRTIDHRYTLAAVLRLRIRAEFTEISCKCMAEVEMMITT
jgi:hypothetical protein